jgi:hypothetical protein
MYCIQQNLLPIFFLDNTSIIFWILKPITIKENCPSAQQAAK